MVLASSTRVRRASVEWRNLCSSLDVASMVLPPYRCEQACHVIVALCRRQRFLAYRFQLADWGWQVKIPDRGGKNVAGIKACMSQSLSQRMVYGRRWPGGVRGAPWGRGFSPERRVRGGKGPGAPPTPP